MKGMVVIGFILAMTLMAQDRNWERVKSLRAGEVVWITYDDGKGVVEEQGRMMACTEDSVAVRINKKDVVIGRNDIRRLTVYAGKSHPRGALWGTIIGLAPGIGLGAVCARAAGGDATAACMSIFSGIGASTGAAVGAAVGVTRKHEVYRASGKREAGDSGGSTAR